MSEDENIAQGDIWDEVYVGYSNGKENAVVLTKHEEGLCTQIDKLLVIVFWLGVLLVFTAPIYFILPKPLAFLENTDALLLSVWHYLISAVFLFTTGNTHGQKIILGQSPDYIKFLRWMTVGLWSYIGLCFCIVMGYNLLSYLAFGVVAVAFCCGNHYWGHCKLEIQKWKDAPDSIGFPYPEQCRFIIFKRGGHARVYEYMGEAWPGVNKYPYEEKQANTIEELEQKDKNRKREE